LFFHPAGEFSKYTSFNNWCGLENLTVLIMNYLGLTHKDYKKFRGTFQLKLPLNIEIVIPDDDSVRLLGQIVEELL